MSDPGFSEFFPGIFAIPGDPGNNFGFFSELRNFFRNFPPGENFVPEIPGIPGTGGKDPPSCSEGIIDKNSIVTYLKHKNSQL